MSLDRSVTRSTLSGETKDRRSRETGEGDCETNAEESEEMTIHSYTIIHIMLDEINDVSCGMIVAPKYSPASFFCQG